MTNDESWFAARCIFDHRSRSQLPMKHTYEERVVLVRAESFEEAIGQAEIEAKQYAKTTEASYLGFVQAFHLHEHPGENTEVFSLMRESNFEPNDYINAFFDTGNELQR